MSDCFIEKQTEIEFEHVQEKIEKYLFCCYFLLAWA